MSSCTARPRWALVAVLMALLSGCTGGGESSPPTSVGAASPAVSSPAAQIPSVPVGGEAYSVAYGFGAAWVQVDPPVDELLKIDSASGQVTLGIKGGTAAAITDDALWVTVAGKTLQKIDPDSGKVLMKIKTPDAYYVSAGPDAIWVIIGENGIARVDPDSGAVTKIAIKGAGELTDLYATGDAVWVTDKVEGRVYRVDPKTNAVVATIPTAVGAHDIAVDDNGVWVTNYTENTVSRIDPKRNLVAATIEDVGSGVGISACDDAIMVSTKNEGISRIDPKTNRVSPGVALSDEWNYGIGCGEDELWISSLAGVVYHVPVPA